MITKLFWMTSAASMLAGTLMSSPPSLRAQEAITPASPSRPIFSQEAVDLELQATRAWLEISLTDYESARFTAVQVTLNSPDRRDRRKVVLVVCGLVNAKNRMGGYNGFQPFWHGSSLPEWRKAGVGPLANDMCRNANRLSATDYSERVAPPAPSVAP
jgi:hypothetical protein